MNIKLLLIFLILLFTQASTAQFLFQHTDSPKKLTEPAEPLEKNPFILRDRTTQIDMRELFKTRDNQQPLVLNVFSDTEISAHIDPVLIVPKGGSFISGSLEDGGHIFLFINKDGIIRGEVHSNSGVYTIKSSPEDKQQVTIQQVDASKFPTGDDVRQFDLDNQNIWLQDILEKDTAQTERQTNQQPDTKIDILAVYTTRAKNLEGGKAQIEATIEAEVAKTNQTLNTSDLDSSKQINLVAMKEVSYTQHSSDMEKDLVRLASAEHNTHDPQGLLDNVLDLRDQYAADFVHLFVRDATERTCGIAYVYNLRSENLLKNQCNSQQNPASCLTEARKLVWKALTFSVSSVRCTTQYTFTHELGHSMGIFHDRYTVNEANPLSTTFPENFPYKPYSFGYVNQNFNRPTCARTIMAYRNQCINEGVRSTGFARIFSNPDLNFLFSDSTTDPAGKSGTQVTTVINGPADASRAIDETWSMLANLKHSGNNCNNAIFSNAPSAINIPAAGETRRITLSHTRNDCSIPTSLTATSTDSFISVSTQKINSSYEVSITVNENDSCAKRTGSVTLTSLTTIGFTINIKQGVIRVCEVITSKTGGTEPGRVTSLDLSKNNISEISGFAFQRFTNLVKLTLKQNQIRSLSADVFSRLTRLKELDLRQNQIRSLANNPFSTLTQLEDLNLSSNQISSLPASVFSTLTQLEDLNLSGNQIRSLTNNPFSALTQLEDLDLSSNRIRSLTASVFSTLTQLEDLNLSGNRIRSLTSTVFNNLSRLKDLNLSNNNITTLNRNIFSSLSRLRYLWLTANDISSSSLPANTFTDLSRLRALGLDGNNLSTLPDGLFNGLSRLRYLWLNGNNLSTLPENIFDGLSRLRYLNLSSNSFNTLPEKVCTFLRNLRYLTIKGSDINRICPAATGRSILQKLLAPLINMLPQPVFIENDSNMIEEPEEYNKNIILKMYEDNVHPAEISELTGHDESVISRTIKN